MSKEEENKPEEEEESCMESQNNLWLHQLEQQKAEIQLYAIQNAIFYCALVENGVEPDHACGMSCAKITAEVKGDLE